MATIVPCIGGTDSAVRWLACTVTLAVPLRTASLPPSAVTSSSVVVSPWPRPGSSTELTRYSRACSIADRGVDVMANLRPEEVRSLLCDRCVLNQGQRDHDFGKRLGGAHRSTDLPAHVGQEVGQTHGGEVVSPLRLHGFHKVVLQRRASRAEQRARASHQAVGIDEHEL